MQEQLKAWITKEINLRQDAVVSGTSHTGNALAEWYRHETGIIIGLYMVKEWMKDFNKKDVEDEED